MLRLDAAGVRTVRFNLYRGGSETLDNLKGLASRVHEVAGWHAELYAESKDLLDLGAHLAALPKMAIDHFGMMREGYPALLRLVERGAKVKATGFRRIDLDVPTALKEVAAADPAAFLCGTDLPGTRAVRPFEESSKN